MTRTSRVRALLAALLASASAASAQLLDTGFSYQGRLTSGGAAATGNHDLRFTLYGDAGGAAQVGSPITMNGVAVNAGLFSVKLDFGAQFQGSKRWLKVEVKPAGGPTYTALPLQEITNAPNSIWSQNPWQIGGPGTLFSLGRNVGIGTATPSDAMTVQVPSSNFGFTHSDGSVALSTYVDGIGGWLGTKTNHRLHFYTNNSFPRMTLDTQGGVGIGTTLPLAKLHVVGTSITHNQAITAESAFLSPGGNAVRGAVLVGSSGDFTSGITGINYAPATVHGGNFGIYGEHVSNGIGVRGTSATAHGVQGLATQAGGIGGYFRNFAGGTALWADGLAQVKTLQILGGADLAEPFNVNSPESEAAIAPGMVVVIDAAKPGELRLADAAYDTRVAGIISGANGLQPGMVMSATDHAMACGKHPVAMTGRVWCYVDAAFGAITPGDRLTTSPTLGHAMKASDASRIPGTVIGKAMTALPEGRGLVLVLVNLQ